MAVTSRWERERRSGDLPVMIRRDPLCWGASTVRISSTSAVTGAWGILTHHTPLTMHAIIIETGTGTVAQSSILQHF